MKAMRAALLLPAIAAAAYAAVARTVFAAQRRILFQPFGTHVPAAAFAFASAAAKGPLVLYGE